MKVPKNAKIPDWVEPELRDLYITYHEAGIWHQCNWFDFLADVLPLNMTSKSVTKKDE